MRTDSDGTQLPPATEGPGRADESTVQSAADVASFLNAEAEFFSLAMRRAILDTIKERASCKAEVFKYLAGVAEREGWTRTRPAAD